MVDEVEVIEHLGTSDHSMVQWELTNQVELEKGCSLKYLQEVSYWCKFDVCLLFDLKSVYESQKFLPALIEF